MFDLPATLAMQRSKGRAFAALTARDGKARLADLAQQGFAKLMLPRVARPVPEAVFLNTSGGLTGGDVLSYGLDLAAGVRLCATTRTAERAYASTQGAAEVRFGDTDIIIKAERDLPPCGEEAKFSGGKVIRDGMRQSLIPRSGGAVDTVITTALIMDHSGICKADVGLRDGRIHGIGKAGNPDTQNGLTFIIGPSTEVIAGEGKILTARGFGGRKSQRRSRLCDFADLG